MSNELQIIDESTITVEVKAEINEDIDRIIAVHKNNRQAINKLVFESIAAMTEADDAQAELSNKGWLKRRIGSITGSNSRLQDRINSNRATALYASQQTLQKLAEQNLMTFDLIAAVNNKLNASLIKVDEEFANIYQGLTKFFKANRSELARIEARLEKVERNVSLLNWQNSIEYQEFDGIEYAELDDVSKIVCLVRDFYDITKGEWSNSDLLLLKSAMRDIDISPKDNVNYFEVLKEISCNERLKGHMLENRTINQIEDPGYLLSLGCIKKFDTLNNEEDYIVDTVVDFMNGSNVDTNRESVCSLLTTKYLSDKAYVNVNVECYDLILDLLYNIRQAKDEKLLSSIYEEEMLQEETLENDNVEEAFEDVTEAVETESGEELYLQGKRYQDGDGVDVDYEQAYNYYQKAAELGNGDAYAGLGWLYEKGNFVECDHKQAYLYYQKAVELESGNGYAGLGYLYGNGFFVVKNEKKAFELYERGAKLGSARAMNNLGGYYYEGNVVSRNYEKAVELFLKASNLGLAIAMCNLGGCYCEGNGVATDCHKAMEWYQKSANLGYAYAMYKIGYLYEYGYGVGQDYSKAMDWYKKANLYGYKEASNDVDRVWNKMIPEETVTDKIKDKIIDSILDWF